MTTTHDHELQLRECDVFERATINIVALNADSMSAAKARQAIAKLISELAPVSIFNYSCWSFSELFNRETFTAVTRAIETADIVVVAGEAEAELPSIVKESLIIALSKRRSAARLLISLLAGVDGQKGNCICPMYRSLRRLALEASISYFPEWVNFEGVRSDGCEAEPVRTQAATLSSDQMPAGTNHYDAWGINE